LGNLGSPSPQRLYFRAAQGYSDFELVADEVLMASLGVVYRRRSSRVFFALGHDGYSPSERGMGENTESPNPGDLVLLLFFERLVGYLTFDNLSKSDILGF
jgi:hypothetical protein